MPRFDPNFAAAYLADNISGDNRNMTEFEEADLSGFGQNTEKNMANFEAAAEEWEAVTEVEATFGAGRKDNLAVVHSMTGLWPGPHLQPEPAKVWLETHSTCARDPASDP